MLTAKGKPGSLPKIAKISPQLVKLSYRLATVLEIILREHIGPKAAPPGGLLRLWLGQMDSSAPNALTFDLSCYMLNG